MDKSQYCGSGGPHLVLSSNGPAVQGVAGNGLVGVNGYAIGESDETQGIGGL